MDYIEKYISIMLDKISDKRYYYSMNRENEFAVDCSSLIIRSLSEAGLKNNATYTGNMVRCLSSIGFKAYKFELLKAKRGDIFLRHISDKDAHTVLYLGNYQIAEACNKKYGLRTCSYYANRYQYMLRFEKQKEGELDLPTLKQGSKNIYVGFLQLFLNKVMGSRLVIDNDFGSRTAEQVLNFQVKFNLNPDKIVGVKTWSKIYSIMDQGL